MCLFFSLAVYLRKNQRDGGEESGPVCSTMCRQLSYPQYLAKEEMGPPNLPFLHIHNGKKPFSKIMFC